MFQSIEKALNFLLSHNKINNQDYFSLHKYYSDLISSGSYDVDSITNDLKGLFSDNGYVNTILSRINSNNNVNSSFVNDVNQVDDEVIDFDNSSVNLNASVISNQNDTVLNHNSVNDKVQDSNAKVLVDVSDFKRGEQNYIKLSYNDGSVRIFENNLEHNGKQYTGEEIFTVLKAKYNENDITKVMHQFTRNSIEIELYDFRDLSNKNIYDNLSASEQQLIRIVMSQYPDKKVLSGSSSNMFVIKEEGKPDILVQVESLNGVYQVRPIDVSVINDELSSDSSDSLSDNDKSNSLGHQKTLSTPIGRMFSDNRESGFMMFVLFIFLAGISSGIIFMIILNFIA